MGGGRSVNQISAEVGHGALIDLLGPVGEFIGVPELAAQLEVCEHGVFFALLEEFFGQGHVGAEAAEDG